MSSTSSSTSGTIRDTVRETARETARDVKEAARESGKAASAASGDIQADLQALRDDVTRLATQIADIFAAKGNVAWSRAKTNVEGVVSDVGAKGQEAIDAAHKVVDAIDESLQTRPYTTLAVALGIGFLLGAMWRR